MSGNGASSSRKMDRRVLRTRGLLGRALVELVQEKPFAAITVQEVLDRARIGRSTFYVHFRDKDDLFRSEVGQFLESISRWLFHVKDAGDRLAPVRELFAHVAEMHRLYVALATSGLLPDFLDQARECFARSIAERLALLPRACALPAAQRTPMAVALAGSMLALLTWWLEEGTPGTAAQMDELFHQLAWRGVASAGVFPAL